jgi:1,4-alpha-glucan branching enzyme
MVKRKKHDFLFIVWFIFKGKRIVDEYEWKYDNYVPLVPDEKLIIYELHIGDFHDKFKDITAKMDYFIELGVTAGK